VQAGVQHVPSTHVAGLVQVPQETWFPQLLMTVPQLEVPHVTFVAAGVQPHIPVTPAPPQVCPVPEQVVGHCTALPQLFVVVPQCPPEQVVAELSSVQVAQSLPSALHVLPEQAVVV
jgi:hypothetical protein